jgi:hypothetical protein
MSERGDGSLARRLTALLGGGAAQRIAVRDRGRILLLFAQEIECVEAEGDYASLRVGEKSYLVRETMAAMEARLGPGFLRIHRSVIVNAARIRELRPQPNGEFMVVLHSGLEVRASRGYADRLRGRHRKSPVDPLLFSRSLPSALDFAGGNPLSIGVMSLRSQLACACCCCPGMSCRARARA